MTIKEFLKTKTFKQNALAAIGITIFLIVLNMFAIRIYTDHGKSVEIPALKGKTNQEISELLDKLDLRFQIRDSVYSQGTVPGTVLDQYPKSGTKVKRNRTIYITLSAFNQEKIPMPQLTDISYRQARNLIESSGLVAGRISYRASEFPDLVLEQKIGGRSIRIGEMVPKGSVVDLVLGGDGQSETSEVPTLFGRSLTDAQQAITDAYLSIGTVSYDESFTSEDQKEKGLIWKQSPDPSETLEVSKGTTIDLWLTMDPEKLKAKPEEEKPENSFF